jgi:hypothetical protein
MPNLPSRILTFSLAICLLASCARSRNAEVEEADAPQRVMPGYFENSCNYLYLKNERGQRLSWKGKVPIVITLDPSFPQEFISAFVSAMNTWNLAMRYKIFEIGGYNNVRSLSLEDRKNVAYFLHPTNTQELNSVMKPLFYDGSAAMTKYISRRNRIVESDIIFDGTARGFSAGPDNGALDFETTALHELGHVLGMDHNNMENSIMYRHVDSSQRTLDSQSIQLLSCEY